MGKEFLQENRARLDLYRTAPADPDTSAPCLLKRAASGCLFSKIENAIAVIRRPRLARQPRKIEARRQTLEACLR